MRRTGRAAGPDPGARSGDQGAGGCRHHRTRTGCAGGCNRRSRCAGCHHRAGCHEGGSCGNRCPAAAATAAPAAAAGTGPFAGSCWTFPTQPVTIEIWWHTYAPLDAYVKELIEAYQKLHPNVKINPTIAAQTDLNQKLTVALATGAGPDIIDQDISFFPAYYQKNTLEPLNLDVFCSKSTADVQKAYVAGGLDGVTFDGKIYGLPYQSNSMSMFLNNDIFKEAGLDPVKDAPKTWDDMKTLGAKLMKKDAGGKVTRNGYEFPYQSQRWMLQEFQPMLEQYGGKLVSADGKQCQLNSDAAVKALTTWREVSKATGDPALMLATRGAAESGLHRWAHRHVDDRPLGHAAAAGLTASRTSGPS